jgi:hypothetical protein
MKTSTKSAASSSKTALLRSMMVKDATLPNVALTPSSVDPTFEENKAKATVALSERTAGKPAKTRKAQLLADREVRALRRTSKLLHDTIARLSKTALRCNVGARTVIDTAQSAIKASLADLDGVAVTLTALRATDWQRTDGDKVVAPKKGIEPGATMWLRAKFAADFTGIISLTDELTVVRAAGANVVVMAGTEDGGVTKLVVARRVLTTSFDGEPKDPITAEA